MKREEAELLKRITQTGDLQMLTDLCGEFFHNPVFVSDVMGNVLAYSSAGVKSLCFSEYIRKVDSLLVKDEIISSKRISHKICLTWEGEIKASTTKQTEKSFLATLRLLTDHNRPVGILVVMDINDSDDSVVCPVLDMLAEYFERAFRKSKYCSQVFHNDVANIIIKLLDGDCDWNKATVEEKMRACGWKAGGYPFLITMPGTCIAQSGHDMLRKLADGFNVIAFPYRESLVCLIRMSEERIIWDETEICHFIAREGLNGGVSRQMPSCYFVGTAYNEATTAYALGKSLRHNATRTLFPYNEYSVYHMLMQLSEKENLYSYCMPEILKLKEFDDSNHLELVPTLNIYINSGRNLQKASNIMHLHRNTIRYRLGQCADILHVAINDIQDLSPYILSLRIVELYQGGLIK